MSARFVAMLVATLALACAPAAGSLPAPTSSTSAASTGASVPSATMTPSAAPTVPSAASATASAAATSASAPRSATFAVALEPTAPGVDEVFLVVVSGLSPREQVSLNLHPLGILGRPFTTSADDAGVAGFRTTTHGIPAGVFVVTAQRADGATAEVRFNVQSSGPVSVPPTPNVTATPAPTVRVFVPFQCAAFTDCPNFDPLLTCSPAFMGATQAVYHNNDVVSFEFCLPRIASSLTLWSRSTIPGVPPPPFAPFHDISAQSYGHEAGAFRATTPRSGLVETWTIRAIADGVNYDITFQVAP